MQCLDNPHSWTTGPVEAARGCLLEANLLGAEPDRLQAGVGENYDLGWNCRRKADVIGSRHSVDKKSRLVTPCYGIDYGARLWWARFSGQLVRGGKVIEASFDATHVTLGN